MRLEVQQEIEVGLAVPDGRRPADAGRVEGWSPRPPTKTTPAMWATYAGEYEARFYYASGVTEEAITPLLDDHEYQYVLVA